MNADWLLAHYERIADAPEAISRLRRFTLDLAVRGKLVEQNLNDEPASELLKRVAAEKARLVKTKRIKKLEVDPIGEKVAPFSVPSLWQWTRLGTVGDWGAGSTPSRGNPDLYGGGLTWLKSGELNDNTQLRGSGETVTELAVQKGSFRINCPGDVLIAMYGATIGKLAILAEKAVTNQAVCGCTPFEGVFNKYLFLFLLSQREGFYATSEGGAQPNISKAKIVGWPISLPPLAEQHRIVSKVDELMALCDRLEAARTEREATRDRMAAVSLIRLNDPDPDPVVFRNHAAFALENLAPLTTRTDQIKSLRQTILNLAVRGKLVEQDPNDEPAAELVKRIAAEKARLVKAREIRNPKQVSAINADECFFDSPRGWEWKRLSEISRKIHYGFTASANNMIDAVRLLRITDIQDNSVDWVSVPGCEIGEKALPQFKLEKGDILVARTGGTIGKSFLVQDVPVVAVFASYLIRVQGSHEIYDRHLKLFLESPVYWIQLQDGSRGAGQPNVNGQTLGKMLFPLPPLAEQHRIVVKIDELMALCDRVEANLATGDDTRRRLLDALLHEVLPARRSGGHLTKRKTHTPRAIRMGRS